MTDSLFSVAGQVVWVSGGSRGIGRAIAAGFVKRGAQVIITSRDADSLAKTAGELQGGKPVQTHVCDVAAPEQIRETAAALWEQYGPIDTLVNVAGVNRRKAALDVTEEDFDFVVDINLKGAFLLSQEVGRRMVARQSGAQINIASLNTDRPLKNVAPYALSKAAMGQMTRSLAMEWGPHQVRVNGIAPGFILTDLTEKLWSDPAMREWGLANTPQRRLGLPEDMVGAAIFLASPASAFMTGQTLYVDGGFTAGWSWPIPE
ncbi:SDR family NAD(P)-dependent oxidoreductase [Lignipirellula cremea]|uniref:Gluconate 5-dehydrogenase n=1 Tax=Lignipirellula cremea TaxID=2528010 RepID=A0A518DYY7_9BACT|nr:glucose 1-dehydrogenase [Lignipirellula cremea]QDU97060.1 Gluconate 5-dehydrogenase [Lignipirellula cremea]